MAFLHLQINRNNKKLKYQFLDHTTLVSISLENEVQVITTSQIKLESLLHRIGNCCLTLSAILFLGQIINASLNWDLDVGSVITGFGFSIFLFMSWACIDSVYGKGASEVSGEIN